MFFNSKTMVFTKVVLRKASCRLRVLKLTVSVKKWKIFKVDRIESRIKLNGFFFIPFLDEDFKFFLIPIRNYVILI
jgi:hypothetical protein